jgi:hypothetical protein
MAKVWSILSSFLKIVSGNSFAVNEGSSSVKDKMVVGSIPNSVKVVEGRPIRFLNNDLFHRDLSGKKVAYKMVGKEWNCPL